MWSYVLQSYILIGLDYHLIRGRSAKLGHGGRLFLRRCGDLWYWLRCLDWRRRRFVQHECVVHLCQLAQSVLFEAHETLKRWRLLACTAHAMDHMTFLLLTNEQHVENFQLKNGAKFIELVLVIYF